MSISTQDFEPLVCVPPADKLFVSAA